MEVQDLAPDYDAWNRKRGGSERRRPGPRAGCARGEGGAHPGHGPARRAPRGVRRGRRGGCGRGRTPRYGPDATGRDGPAPPWTRLLDAKTNHPYFWNRATGASGVDATETHTDVPRTEACTKNGEGGKRKTLHQVVNTSKNPMRERRTRQTTLTTAPRPASVSGAKKAESRDAFTTATFSAETELETFSRRLEKTLVDAVTLSARSVLRREMTRLVRDDGLDTTEASELLRSRVPAVERAVERALGAEDAKTKKDGETAKAETARVALLPRRATAFPPPLPDSPPPSPPPPPGAIARPPALRETLGAAGVSFPIKKKKKRTTGTDPKVKKTRRFLLVRACVPCASRGPPPPRWWSGGARREPRMRRRPREPTPTPRSRRPAGRPRWLGGASARRGARRGTSLGTQTWRPSRGTGANARRRPGFGASGCRRRRMLTTRKRTKRTNTTETHEPQRRRTRQPPPPASTSPPRRRVCPGVARVLRRQRAIGVLRKRGDGRDAMGPA